AADASVAEKRDALARRDASDQAFRLDVPDERRQQRWSLAKDGHRTAHELAIVRNARPLIAIGVFLRNLPKSQGVVGEMVVEFDQPGERGPAGVDDGSVLEARGDWID